MNGFSTLDEPPCFEHFLPLHHVEIRESVERIVFLSIKYLTHHAISFTDLLSFSLSPFEEGSSAILRPSLRGPPSDKLGSSRYLYDVFRRVRVRFLLSSKIKIHLEWVDREKEN